MAGLKHMKWQKLLSKNSQNLFLLMNQMKDLTWKKADLAEKLGVDVKTIDRHLKRLETIDFPVQLIYQKKTVRLIYNLGYSEPYLLFDFLIHSASFRLLKDLILKEKYQESYDRPTQERLRKWLGEYHLSFSYKKGQIFGSERKVRYLLFSFLKDFPHFFVDDGEESFSEIFIRLLKQRNRLSSVEILGDNQTIFLNCFQNCFFEKNKSYL
nr:HTH domain-containing protein [Enterococcus sp. MSG2901]